MTKRTNKYTFQQSLYDGESLIYKVKKSGDVYQFHKWIAREGKHYRKSLRTKDYDIALAKAKQLTKELMSNEMNEQLVFSITIEELIKRYLAYRKLDIAIATGITDKRWSGMKSQLKYFSRILGAETQLSSIKQDALFEYATIRQNLKKCSMGTARNETSTFNSMIKFGYRNKLIHFEKLFFKEIVIKADFVGRRDTFTEDEYDKLVRFMRSWSNIKNCNAWYRNNDFGRTERKTKLVWSAEHIHLERLMIRDYVLATANTCMRVGEIDALTYNDIKGYEYHTSESEYDNSEKEQILVEISVRAETSKVRKNRKFLSRGGQYFQRITERSKHTNDEDLVFSVDGKKRTEHKRKRQLWIELMEGIGIFDWEVRKLTWYSLRHYGITQRVQSGVDLIDISIMCGTSVKHITDTYLHYRKEQSRTAALKSYKKTTDKKGNTINKLI